jgi:hypothetical protein
MVSKNVVNIGIANLFTDADVQSDYIISEKVGYLPLLEVLLMFLILRKLLRLLKHLLM